MTNSLETFLCSILRWLLTFKCVPKFESDKKTNETWNKWRASCMWCESRTSTFVTEANITAKWLSFNSFAFLTCHYMESPSSTANTNHSWDKFANIQWEKIKMIKINFHTITWLFRSSFDFIGATVQIDFAANIFFVGRQLFKLCMNVWKFAGRFTCCTSVQHSTTKIN